MRKVFSSRPPALARGICLSVLQCLGAGVALAQDAGAAAEAATTAAAAPERTVDVLEYVVRGNSVLDVRAIERAVTPFLGPRKTLKDLEAAREALNQAYQAGGYQSVHVDLPEQQVTEGIVYLRVNETRVGRLRVTGAEYTSPRDVRDQVPALREGAVPNFTQAQAELTDLNRGGQRQVMPLVRQGAVPGTMDVDLKVEDSSPWRASVGLNNDNSADTSKLRLTTTLGHNNLWQLGHSASLSLFVTPQDLDQTKVLSGSYTAPLRASRWSLEASGYVSDSDVSTTGGTAVLSKGYAVGLKAVYAVPASDTWWHSFSVGIDLKNNKESLTLGTGSDEVPLKYAPITLAYSGYYQGERTQVGLGLSLVYGTRSFFGWGSNWAAFDRKRYKATSGFMLAKADVNGSRSFASGAQLGLRLSGQMTDSPLVSGEQLASGGMNSVRGYLAAESVGDVGLVGSLELRSWPLALPAIALENARLYVFTDFGHLRLRDPLPEQADRFTQLAVGAGASFQLGRHVNGRFDLGYPLRQGARTERHDLRTTFSLQASY
jgi:hemolysin activation/secretion protein